MPLVTHRIVAASCAVLLAAGLVGGCGGDTEADTPAVAPTPTATPQDFPAATGRSLADLQEMVPEGPVLSATVTVLEKGRNRVGFGLFDTARKQLGGANVALYVSRSDGSELRGPVLARAESLEVGPQFRSRQTAADPDAANHLYVADLDFPRRGAWAVTAVARLDGRLVRTSPTGMKVGSRGARPPAVGERAPRIHTPTVADVGGDLAAIDTRLPPLRALHDSDVADVLGKEPLVLVFATPQLCQSRVCGPVVDVTAQVQSRVGDDVRFVHMEIYNENDVAKGFRPQIAAYRLPTEPWTFVIDRRGIVRERFEGAMSVRELARAVDEIR